MGSLFVGLFGLLFGGAFGAVARGLYLQRSGSGGGAPAERPAPDAGPAATVPPALRADIALAEEIATKVDGRPWWASDEPRVVAAYENIYAMNREMRIAFGLGWEIDTEEFQRQSVEKRLRGHEHEYDKQPTTPLTGGRPGTGTTITWRRARPA